MESKAHSPLSEWKRIGYSLNTTQAGESNEMFSYCAWLWDDRDCPSRREKIVLKRQVEFFAAEVSWQTIMNGFEEVLDNRSNKWIRYCVYSRNRRDIGLWRENVRATM